jgi:hypothetical protein
MPLTVCDLIGDPNLGLELVVVENDLDRRVRRVHTTELADPSRYLQGDEVIPALEASVERNAAFVRAAEHGEGLDGVLQRRGRGSRGLPLGVGPRCSSL